MLSGVLPANCIIKVICISYRYSAVMFERQNRSGIILSEAKKMPVLNQLTLISDT